METTAIIPIWLVWASYISALVAIPGAIAAFITLFIKDKNKQRQINKLTEIANSLKAQNTILEETLNLYRKQLRILTDLNSINIESSQEQEKMNELDRQIKLAQFRPIITYNGGSSSPREVIVNLLVSNADAVDITSEVVSDTSMRIMNKGPYDISVDNTYGMVVHAAGNESANRLQGEVKLTFKDRLGNEYIQSVHINSGNIKTDKANKTGK